MFFYAGIEQKKRGTETVLKTIFKKWQEIKRKHDGKKSSKKGNI